MFESTVHMCACSFNRMVYTIILQIWKPLKLNVQVYLHENTDIQNTRNLKLWSAPSNSSKNLWNNTDNGNYIIL